VACTKGAGLLSVLPGLLGGEYRLAALARQELLAADGRALDRLAV
jgi:hypothetical protein